MKKLLLLLITACNVCHAQIISTYAGDGIAGYTSDGIPATTSELYNAYGVWADNAGNLYIADALNNRVRKVTPTGVIQTIAGTGVSGFSGDGGPATLAELNFPVSVAVDAAGNVYINDMQNNRIREIKAGGGETAGSGNIYTIAGTGAAMFSGDGGQATNAAIYSPQGLFIDAAGNIFFGDELNHRVRKISPSGIITTIAGNGVPGYSGDGVAATASGLYNPSGVATDAAGNIYIADYFDSRIRKVNTSGIITTIAGTGTIGYSGDGGPATLAHLRYPKGVFLDASDNVYITDSDNDVIRKIDHATGIITTIAGTGVGTYGGDGGLATNAQVFEPQGIFVDAHDNIFIGDCLNNRVRYIHHASTTGNLNLSSGKINIYPNPANTKVVIKSSDQLIKNVTVSNLMGQDILNNDYNTPQVEVNISDLPPGLYIVKINNTEIKKIIKQ